LKKWGNEGNDGKKIAECAQYCKAKETNAFFFFFKRTGEETRITAILPEVFDKPKDQICRSETFGSSTTEVIKGKNGQLMTTCAPKNCPIDVEALVDEIIEECEVGNIIKFIHP
jgi:hypothetical protein